MAQRLAYHLRTLQTRPRQETEAYDSSNQDFIFQTRKVLVRASADMWSKEFTDIRRPLNGVPTLQGNKVDRFMMMLRDHREDTHLHISFLRKSGQRGERSLDEICTAIRRAIERMQK
jgi:hypothetical protein